MSINEVIIYIMVIFAVLGALDRIIGNRFGLGDKFEEGIKTIGPLSLSMVGIIVMAPVIANILEPIIVPVFKTLGADPAMFAGSILANDMGGASLAKEMALTEEAGQFGGLIVGSMMGVTVVFTIPAALGMIEKEDRSYLATGVLAGVITIPLGSFVGGLTAGFALEMVIRNLIPIIIFALFLALGLWKFEIMMIKGFIWFGKFVQAVITLGLGLGIIEALTGISVIKGMNPISDGFEIVAQIVIVLAGAYPLVYVLTKLLRKPLMQVGKILMINEISVAGMIASLASSIPMFGMIKDMDKRGKIINVAFAVSAAFVLGDHLGFTAGFDSRLIVPVIVGKLVSGISAVIVTMFITRSYKKKVTL